jgi:hypothetical protein
MSCPNCGKSEIDLIESENDYVGHEIHSYQCLCCYCEWNVESQVTIMVAGKNEENENDT